MIVKTFEDERIFIVRSSHIFSTLDREGQVIGVI